MQIIGLSGLARSGKSVLAKEIARIAYERAMKPRMMSVATPLREAAARIGVTKEANEPAYRKLLQVLGTDMMRNPDFIPGFTGPDYWVNLTRKRLDQLVVDEEKQAASIRAKRQAEAKYSHQYSDGSYYFSEYLAESVVIFDDVRFMNEVEMIRALGGTMIYVDRAEDLPNPNAEYRKHESERLAWDMKGDVEKRMSLYQYTVDSSGSMDEYMERARPFIPVWLGLSTIGLIEESNG